MDLVNHLKKETIFFADSFQNTDAFYSEYANFLKEKRVIGDADAIKRLFVKREGIQSTGIKRGAAAPHIFSEDLSEFIFSLAVIREGLDFKAPDNEPVFLVFLIMSGEREVGLHLKALAHIARMVRSTDIVAAAKKAVSAAELISLFGAKESLI